MGSVIKEETRIDIGHFPQKSPVIRGSFAKIVLQENTACCQAREA